MWAKIIYRLLGVVGTVSLAAAIFMIGFAWYESLTGVRSVGQSVSNQIEWANRVVFRRFKHEPQPKDVDNEPWTKEDELAAIELGKDFEDENDDDRRLEEAMTAGADIILRAKKRGINIPRHFRKAYMWLPFDWKHDDHVPWLTKMTTGWIDRDEETTRDGIPTDVLDLARKIWKTKRKTEPNPNTCALHIVRPKDHKATKWSGELEARKHFRTTPLKYVRDPAINRGRYRTEFYCAKEDADRIQKLLDEAKQKR